MSRHANDQPMRYADKESLQLVDEPTILCQFHHQKIGSPKEHRFIAQRELRSSELHVWLREVNAENPPPEGWEWMFCDKNFEGFERKVT